MKPVYAIADNIVSPLGFDSGSNWNALLGGKSGVRQHQPSARSPKSFHAALLDEETLAGRFAEIGIAAGYTRLEQMYILSIRDAVSRCEVEVQSNRTLFLFSTTKGNIDLLAGKNKAKAERLGLPAMARHISRFFGNTNAPVVLSNACISGVIALLMGSYYLRQGLYDHVVVTGGDIVSRFTLSGFSSLQALGAGPCKPFDASRDGINLGEACATVVLGRERQSSTNTALRGGATSNDANHISGPSRTGEGLLRVITQALRQAGVSGGEIGYVSAHGTATLYNDEMEAKALHAAGLGETPINSLKGYYGHTLGAAGVLETVLAAWSLRNGTLLPSLGYSQHGVSLPLRVVQEKTQTNVEHCLKTASGFGGCNAALVLSKHE